MKKIIFCLVLAGIPTLAAQLHAADKPDASARELCMLYTQSCSNKMHDFQQKIEAIQKKIATGATVYSPAEIDQLEKKLKAAEDTMDRMLAAPLRH